ncbi:MAG: iron-containing alcohol dehydrogenase [Eggerthellaceae bacterium]|nr:iron-containing alcohol dehydrogenase [Eggerthellaceae bacterium]MBQ9044251.1 iron-containing alcohol dehydrogenase [Eggerthellaceae bacterium]
MNDFVFCSPTKFVLGKGAVDKTGAEMAAAGFGKVLLVYGQGSVVRSGVLDRVKASLEAAGVPYVEAGGARPNPEVCWVRDAIAVARENQVEGVLAVGGGSVIDAAKATAFGVPYEGDVWDFFANKQPIGECLPIAAVLTIPAAGSEASASCVISCDAENRKLGASGDVFRPKLAIMDPEVTFTLPAYQTAAGVTDMIAHICERYFSGVGAVPVTDNIATGLVCALMDAAPRVLEQPDDYDARATIMWAGTLAHNDIAGCGRSLNPTARAGGWESHALEHELSAHHPEITHGAGLAVVMPAWMRYVWRTNPERFLDFAADVFGIEPVEEEYCPRDEAVEDAVTAAIDELQAFFRSLGMPATLADFGLTPDDIDPLLETLRASKGEPFGAFQKLTMEDARAIYLSMF